MLEVKHRIRDHRSPPSRPPFATVCVDSDHLGMRPSEIWKATPMDVRPSPLSHSWLFPLLCTILMSISDDTIPESHRSQMSELEISYHDPGSQLPQQRMMRIKVYEWIPTKRSLDEPSMYEEDDRSSGGMWVEGEEGEVTVIRVGPVS